MSRRLAVVLAFLLVLSMPAPVAAVDRTTIDEPFSEQSLSKIFPEADSFSEPAGEYLESIFTRHDADGEVARLNEAGVLFGPSLELVALLRRCRTLYNRTDGAFDPTVLPVLSAHESAWDDPRDARRRVADVSFDSVAVSDSTLRAPTPITLDGVAKGAVVDAGVAALRDWVDAGLVEAGGDVRAFGGSDGRWRVGVEDPRGDGLVTTLHLGSGCVATSGDYRIYYDEDRTVHHIATPGARRGWDTVLEC